MPQNWAVTDWTCGCVESETSSDLTGLKQWLPRQADGERNGADYRECRVEEFDRDKPAVLAKYATSSAALFVVSGSIRCSTQIRRDWPTCGGESDYTLDDYANNPLNRYKTAAISTDTFRTLERLEERLYLSCTSTASSEKFQRGSLRIVIHALTVVSLHSVRRYQIILCSIKCNSASQKYESRFLSAEENQLISFGQSTVSKHWRVCSVCMRKSLSCRYSWMYCYKLYS